VKKAAKFATSKSMPFVSNSFLQFEFLDKPGTSNTFAQEPTTCQRATLFENTSFGRDTLSICSQARQDQFLGGNRCVVCDVGDCYVCASAN
jgi:hypothetical protein